MEWWFILGLLSVGSVVGRPQFDFAGQSGQIRICSMKIRVENVLFKHLGTKQAVESRVSSLIDSVNEIFAAQVPTSGGPIQFRVDELQIDEDESFCSGKGKDFTCDKTRTEDWYLYEHSSLPTNHQDFCLSYILTYRDFTFGGFVKKLAGRSFESGVCVPPKATLNENVGYVTLRFGRDELDSSRQINALAHAIGSSFGARTFSQGSPCSSEGAIMADRPPEQGSKALVFSECSREAIAGVVAEIDGGRRRNCLE